MNITFTFSFLTLLLTSCLCVKVTNISAWMSKVSSSEYKSQGIDGIYRIAQERAIRANEYLYKKNSEVTTKWLSTKTWAFTSIFMDLDIPKHEHINLVLDGVDTVGTMFLQGYPLGTLNNMFKQYIFDLKHLYRDEYNTFEMKLNAPVSEVGRLYKAHSEIQKLLPACPPDSYNGDCYVFMLRKMQASFGSSFGPSIPSMGIWKYAYVEGYNETIIRHVLTETVDYDDDSWQLVVTVHFAGNNRNRIEGSLNLEFQFPYWTNVTTYDVVTVPNDYGDMVQTVTWMFRKDEVDSWWPNEYGDQKLYRLNVTFTNGAEISWKSVRVGFRKIELIEEDVDDGSKFYFRVNDVPVFVKGTITVPFSLQPELGQDRQQIYKSLSYARDQHMNMIRIWGGGVYESDALYEIADELGLMVWQDFMFTDYSYPSDYEDYLENVLDEVRYQVKRIYGHPSVVLFCGNDEGEQAIADNRYHIKKNKEYFVNNYISLRDTIKAEFLRLTNNRGIFISSTPTNGKLNDEAIDDDRNALSSGDAHIFNYENDPFNLTSYKIPRFCSAYGIQSLPAKESFLRDTFGNVSDLSLDGEFMQSRQHYTDGYDVMRTLIGHQLELPDSDDESYFEVFSYYSQIIQAVGMKLQTEVYRSYRNATKSNHGYTMGTLYYHFNDVWTAPSWSGIDYYGKWKMLQYYAYKFFDPVIISGRLETKNDVTSLNFFVVTDLRILYRATATISVCRYDELGPSDQTTVTKIDMDAGSAKVIKKITDLDEFLLETGCSRQDCFITLALDVNGDLIAPENFVLPAKLKESNLGQPNLQLSVSKLPYEEVYEITVTTDKNALFVWLDAHDVDGHFSDNGFVQTTASKVVFFYSDVVTSEEELRSALTVTHVADRRSL